MMFDRILRFLPKLHQMEDDLIAGAEENGLTDLQKNLMTVLYLSGPENLSSLSHCLHINMPNCSREVKKLAEKGYIRKTDSCRDRRVIQLSLTDPGRELVRTFLEGMRSAYFDRTDHWTPERIERVLTALDILETDFLLPEK